MRRRLALTIASALVLLFALPPFDGWYIGWVALVPLLMALEGTKAREASLVGYLWGVVFFTGTLWWVVHSMHYYGGMGFVSSVAVMLLLVAYLAIYPALFCLLFRGFELVSPYLSIIGGAALWTGLEYLRGWLFTGMPWALVGYTQVPAPSMIQIAEFTGVWGVSFWLVAVNITIYLIIRALGREDVVGVLKYMVFTGVIVIMVFSYGIMRLNTLKVVYHEWDRLTIGVVQGNIEQSQKWKKQMKTKTLEIYQTLIERAKKEGAELVILPETAMPFYLAHNMPLGGYLKGIAKKEGVSLLVGSPHYERTEGEIKVYNSAFLIDREGNIIDRYDKVHLVPFGEYVPLKKILFFVDKLAEGVGDFSSGEGFKPLKYGKTAFGVLICYEAIFPEISAEFVRRGASFLVNITNDGWFGRTWGPYQHFAISVMRAIEGRVFVVRAANTGISGLIAPTGEVLIRGPLMEKYWFVSTIGLNRAAKPTFFSRHPFIFPCLVGLVAVIFIVSAHLKRRNSGVRRG